MKAKWLSDNWLLVSGLGAAICAIVGGIWSVSAAMTTGQNTLHAHSAQLDEIRATAQVTSDKVDQKFDAINLKLDKISDGTNYIRGKVDEMDRSKITGPASPEYPFTVSASKPIPPHP